jgi:prolipoprotein diacylglyceryltransferase
MSGEARITALTIFAGLVVSWVRNGLQHHWRSFPSWGWFFTLWIVHIFGVVLFCGIALAAIIYTHKLFLGYNLKNRDGNELYFYIVMTVLVGALSVAALTHLPPTTE